MSVTAGTPYEKKEKGKITEMTCVARYRTKQIVKDRSVLN